MADRIKSNLQLTGLFWCLHDETLFLKDKYKYVLRGARAIGIFLASCSLLALVVSCVEIMNNDEVLITYVAGLEIGMLLATFAALVIWANYDTENTRSFTLLAI